MSDANGKPNAWGAMDPRSPLVKGSEADEARSDAMLIEFTADEKLLHLRYLFALTGYTDETEENVLKEIEAVSPKLLRRMTYEN